MKNMKKRRNVTAEKNGFGRIIAPVDGSEYAKRAIKRAFFLAKQTGKEVVALYVIDTPRMTQTIPPDDISVTWREVLQKQGKKLLDDIEKKGSEQGIKVVKKLVEGIPEQEIMNAAKKDDLIIMGCKGMSSLDKILLGSVCDRVVTHADAPVMVIR